MLPLNHNLHSPKTLYFGRSQWFLAIAFLVIYASLFVVQIFIFVREKSIAIAFPKATSISNYIIFN